MERKPGPPPTEAPPPVWLPESFDPNGEATELESLQNAWPEIVDRCQMVQPLIKQQLRDSWPVSLTETRLTVGFDPEFKKEIAVVRQFDHGALHRMFSQILGRSIKLEYEVLDHPVTWSHLCMGDEEAPQENDEPFSPETAGSNPQAWLRNASVRQVLEIFHGDVLNVQR